MEDSKEKEAPTSEEVDGPKIAAQILNRMPNAHREKLVAAIQKAQPQLAEKIAESLFNFDDITELNTKGLQTLLVTVDQRDIVLSLKTASNKAKDVILNNLSQRRRELILEDFSALPQLRLKDVEDAQRRILTKLDELRTLGAIRTESRNDIWV